MGYGLDWDVFVDERDCYWSDPKPTSEKHEMINQYSKNHDQNIPPRKLESRWLATPMYYHGPLLFATFWEWLAIYWLTTVHHFSIPWVHGWLAIRPLGQCSIMGTSLDFDIEFIEKLHWQKCWHKTNWINNHVYIIHSTGWLHLPVHQPPPKTKKSLLQFLLGGLVSSWKHKGPLSLFGALQIASTHDGSV